MLAEYGIASGGISGRGGYATGGPNSLSEALVSDPTTMLFAGALFVFCVYFLFVRN